MAAADIHLETGDFSSAREEENGSAEGGVALNVSKLPSAEAEAEIAKKRRSSLRDSLGDLDMAAGVKDPNVVFTIGFLNKSIDKNLEKYRERFDVVLVDDQTMDFPVSLLNDIVSSKH